MAIHDLGSIRNANYFLKDMQKYMNVTQHKKEYVYYLNKTGAELIGHAKLYKKNNRLSHTLMRNEAWLLCYCPESWEIERPIEFGADGEKKVIIPDARYMDNRIPCFVEIDRLQSIKENENKIQTYKILCNLYKQRGVTPIIQFFTISKIRQKNLENLGVKYDVYLQSHVVEEIY